MTIMPPTGHDRAAGLIVPIRRRGLPYAERDRWVLHSPLPELVGWLLYGLGVAIYCVAILMLVPHLIGWALCLSGEVCEVRHRSSPLSA